MDPLSGIFKDFIWPQDELRFLPTPRAARWAAHFALPQAQGQLLIKAENKARPDGEELVVFELTARAKDAAATLENLEPWFEVAHEWIVRGFCDLTDDTYQRDKWGRVDA